MADVLYKVDTRFASFGMLVRDGVVVDVATVAYWAKSKPVEAVLDWIEKEGGTAKIVSEGPSTPREEFVEAYVSCMPSTPPEKAAQVFELLMDEKTEVRRRLSQAIKAVHEPESKKP